MSHAIRRLIALLLLVCLVTLTACGAQPTGTAEPAPHEPAPAAPAPTRAGGDSVQGIRPTQAAAPEPQRQTIERRAECAFPATMQVGRPATVRFSIFTRGNEPNRLPDSVSETEPLILETRPDLELWVAVALDVSNAQVIQEPNREFQRLSERSNIWIWQITPTDASAVALQPVVDVEFRDANGNVVERQQNVWTQTYTIDQVIGSNYLNIAAAWLGDGIQEVIAGFIGALLLRIGTGTRQLVGRRFGRAEA